MRKTSHNIVYDCSLSGIVTPTYQNKNNKEVRCEGRKYALEDLIYVFELRE